MQAIYSSKIDVSRADYLPKFCHFLGEPPLLESAFDVPYFPEDENQSDH
jgi:hypothetical protein